MSKNLHQIKHEHLCNRGEECVICGANPWVMCADCGEDFIGLELAKKHAEITGHDIHG